MKQSRENWQIGAAVGILTLLVFAAALWTRYAPGILRPLSVAQGQPPGQGASYSPLPLPSSAPPTEEIIVITPGPDGVVNLPPATPGQVYAFASPTPPPTPPLPPTPTLVPGPTVTPMPLAKPAADASGSVYYAVLGKPEPSVYLYAYKGLVHHSVGVDERGAVQGEPERLFEVAGTEIEEIRPSPDGSRIVMVGPWGGRNVLYTDSGKVEPMFRDALDPMGLFFGWHPNSRQVLIRAQQNYPDAGLWLVDVDTGAHITLFNQVPSPGAFDGGAISPDGQKVVYSFKGGFTTPAELWMTDVKGSYHHRLYTFGGYLLAITWSPDGEEIAFVGDGLMIMNADGSDLRTLSHTFGGGRGFMPVWSPDSKTIAFTTWTTSEAMTEEESRNPFSGVAIYLINVDTGEEWPLLTDGSVGHIDPAWSPDGSQIAFASMRSGNSEIWLVNINGTNLRQVTDTGKQLVRFPYWLPQASTQAQP